MGMRKACAAALVTLQQTAATASAAGRGLYEGEDRRPGRSDLAYMQHKYTPLDSRIIIITAAILFLLLSILFLNFFIRWALRRLFLLRSQKPINPNKGLSKRQVQALPSFIYSSSKPLTPTPSCGHSSFTLKPFPSHFWHTLYPPTIMTSTKVGGIACQPPTQVEVENRDHNTLSHSTSIQVDKLTSDPHIKPWPHDVHHVLEDSHPLTQKHESVHCASSIKPHMPCTHSEVKSKSPTSMDGIPLNEYTKANDMASHGDGNVTSLAQAFEGDCHSMSDISSPKATVHTIQDEVKGSSPTLKGENPSNDSTNDNGNANHGDDNASSSSPCPICLAEFTDGDIVRVIPTCRHYFHIGCIDLWLPKNSSCPACRANIFEATRATHKEPILQVQVVTTPTH